jgi:hypothetical protein
MPAPGADADVLGAITDSQRFRELLLARSTTPFEFVRPYSYLGDKAVNPEECVEAKARENRASKSSATAIPFHLTEL